jgi:tRNA U55 pseudouridine synthase TruB
MSGLRRTAQGRFKIEDSYTLDDITNRKYHLIGLREALPNVEEVIIDEEIRNKIINGAIIDKNFNNDMAQMIDEKGQMIAIYQTYNKDNTKAKPYRMFI